MPAASLIVSLPTFVSPEEHKALVGSTPASFNDIPPKLCHKEENVSVTLDPPLDDFSVEEAAQGTLYVIERCVAGSLVCIISSFYNFAVFWCSCRRRVEVSRSLILQSLYMPCQEPNQGP